MPPIAPGIFPVSRLATPPITDVIPVAAALISPALIAACEPPASGNSTEQFPEN